MTVVEKEGGTLIVAQHHDIQVLLIQLSVLQSSLGAFTFVTGVCRRHLEPLPYCCTTKDCMSCFSDTRYESLPIIQHVLHVSLNGNGL